MAVNELFPEGSVVVRIDGTTKDDILQRIADLAIKNPALEGLSRDEVYKALADREEIGSTGFGNGIAIPHCSMAKAKAFATGLVIHERGVPFDAIDGKVSRFFFFIVGPSSERGRHVQLLSAISKFAQVERYLDTVANAKDDDAARRYLISHLEYLDDTTKHEAAALMTVFVHAQEYFEDILEILQANTQGSIAVSDMRGPGHYLNSLPLFSALWTDSESQQIQTVQAILQKSRCNDVVRRIHALDSRERIEGAVGIAVQDLFYSSGTINV